VNETTVASCAIASASAHVAIAKYAPRSLSVGQPRIAATIAAAAAPTGSVRKKFQCRSGCISSAVAYAPIPKKAA
jgi:hypothetical protein